MCPPSTPCASPARGSRRRAAGGRRTRRGCSGRSCSACIWWMRTPCSCSACSSSASSTPTGSPLAIGTMMSAPRSDVLEHGLRRLRPPRHVGAHQALLVHAGGRPARRVQRREVHVISKVPFLSRWVAVCCAGPCWPRRSPVRALARRPWLVDRVDLVRGPPARGSGGGGQTCGAVREQELPDGLAAVQGVHGFVDLVQAQGAARSRSSGRRPARHSASSRGTSRCGAAEPMYEPLIVRPSAITDSAGSVSVLEGWGRPTAIVVPPGPVHR